MKKNIYMVNLIFFCWKIKELSILADTGTILASGYDGMMWNVVMDLNNYKQQLNMDK